MLGCVSSMFSPAVLPSLSINLSLLSIDLKPLSPLFHVSVSVPTHKTRTQSYVSLKKSVTTTSSAKYLRNSRHLQRYLDQRMGVLV